ncbi:membrane protein [Iodidimonas muriae]|uniref:Membrane protein n=1 Tax=Iodidimonas muriae TaxID=261467 RepID=A0ABQ2LDD1_9PROT|nr:YeeE/YedE thiosulfate transporter family protein [Iodidimonas muriae]GER07225.1 membrane protein [Kordiimonadales bacterium JCM 17843]GGO11442.1 membrane protein [Iodidimonas muriae]
MTEFTPFAGLAGGAMIGLSAVLAMLFFGRIAGVSGILGGFFSLSASERTWRGGFLLGLIAAPLIYWAVMGEKPEITIPVPLLLVVLGGFLVGVGTILGGGCTSGHGVCGVARLSHRSVIATISFMATGIATVFVMRHLLGMW